jgi:hypothetical protein
MIAHGGSHFTKERNRFKNFPPLRSPVTTHFLSSNSTSSFPPKESRTRTRFLLFVLFPNAVEHFPKPLLTSSKIQNQSKTCV